MKKPLVMVVDDEKDFADSVAAFLQKIGYESVAAYSAAEAFKILKNNHNFLMRTNRVKCILLDIKMPDMDGLQFLEKLRDTYGDYVRIGVIMLTAYEDDDKFMDAAVGSAVGYLKKPWKEEDVRNTLKRFFEGQDEEMALEVMNGSLLGQEKRAQHREKQQDLSDRNLDKES